MKNSAFSHKKSRVGVLRGGPSHEYEVSLRSGHAVLKHLPSHYVPIDIFISRDGAWHVNGIERTPEKILPHVDVVWNALHGVYGEDGKVQTILTNFHVPFTGSGTLPSSLGLNKNFSKALFQYHGFKTPEFVICNPEDNTEFHLLELFQSFPQPSIIKPLHGGSSIGVTYAETFDQFKAGIEKALKYDSAALIEEYIKGREVTGVVIDGSDRDTLFALAPYARKGLAPIFDFESKYNDMARHDPKALSESEKSLVQKISLEVHKKLGLKHFSTVDTMLHPTRGPFVLEVNTVPGLTETSILPQMLAHAGISMTEFIDHTIMGLLNDAQ